MSLLTRAQFVTELEGRNEFPLLVLGLCDLGRLAWEIDRNTASALEQRFCALVARQIPALLRIEDLVCYEPGGGQLLIALCSRGRQGGRTLPVDARLILRRLADLVDQQLGTPLDTGWTLTTAPGDLAALSTAIGLALERGAAERERYAFFSTVGHELRTPLTAIRGYLETLLDDDLPAATRRRFTEIAYTESLRVQRLVEGMFSVSLIDMSAADQKPAQCHAATAIRTALAAQKQHYDERGMLIIDELDDTLHAAINADHLVQIMTNLLDNAAKHAHRRGPVRISLRSTENRYLCIGVEDHGPGIASALRERIFELGTRGESSAPGSGIGLAIVRLLLDRVGASIECGDSTLGGAAFWIHLQRASAERTSPAPLRSSA